MKKYYLILFSVLLFSVNNSSAQQDHNMNMKQKDSNPAVIIPGLGNYHHKVSTDDAEAQKFFDQGLTLIYAFNHNEAIRSFEKAAELDPELAMAYWGIAFSLGPNYNLPADNDQRKLAYKSIKKAIKNSEHASQQEKDYISALSKRYTKDVNAVTQQKLDQDFKNAMKLLHEKYPDDPDAAVLYAESLMDLKPWQLWNKDGTPAEGTMEIVTVLESVLKAYPNHPGANHYYIHAVEASDDPGRALQSCKVLKTLVPAAGHLVHMPAHTLFRIGDYEGTSEANIEAIKADQIYIKNYNPQGVYPFMYYNHNLNFLSVSLMMEGRYNDAMKYANMIAENIKPVLKDMPMAEGIYLNPLMILNSFSKWDEIINFPQADTAYKVYSALYHSIKGVAYAEKGKSEDAKAELQKAIEFRNKIAPDAFVGLNSAELVADLSIEILKGKIERVSGDKQKAVEFLTNAVKLEDSLNYDEPPDWYPSVKLSLGATLYMNDDYAGAENVFREQLKQYPHNGRGLFGLTESLKAQGKTDEAKIYQNEFELAWKNSDVRAIVYDY